MEVLLKYISFILFSTFYFILSSYRCYVFDFIFLLFFYEFLFFFFNFFKKSPSSPNFSGFITPLFSKYAYKSSNLDSHSKSSSNSSLNNFVSFDIETYIDSNNVHIPYAIGLAWFNTKMEIVTKYFRFSNFNSLYSNYVRFLFLFINIVYYNT